MINLRYHVVSLVAVFLALGIGIVVGSTVIDRVTVDALNTRLDNVRNDINSTRDENRRLTDRINRVQEFADQSLTHVLRDQLLGVPVLVVAVNGIDHKPVESLRQSLTTAGATLQGTVWITSKMRLDNEGEVVGLATVLDVVDPQSPSGPAVTDDLRRQALGRMLTQPESLAALVSAGFLSFEPPAALAATSTTGPPAELGAIPQAGTRFVVVSGAGAEVGDDILAVPMAQVMAGAGVPAVAAEAGVDSNGGRAVFVGTIRGEATTNGKISTVDNLESAMGQAAAVLAVEELGDARVGHFGVGPGAQRLLPALPA